MDEFGDLFAPDPLLQEEIDDALEKRRKARQDEGWSSKRGVVIDPEALKRRQAMQFKLDSRQYAVSASSIPASFVQVTTSPYGFGN